MKLNLTELNKRVTEGLIMAQKHPFLPLTLYNYTPECQFGKLWDEYSLMARGLVLDDTGEIIARPFDKFFNLDEGVMPNTDPLSLEEVLKIHGKPKIEEKIDGSLGILFKYDGQLIIATRGSFSSDQALEAKNILKEMDIDTEIFELGYTYLFEIIYPENRIVLNYGKRRELVYLATRNNDTGEYLFESNIAEQFNCPELYKQMVPHIENKEGYVLSFKDGFRVKVKFDEYVRLHRIMTGFTSKRLWDLLRNGDNVDLKDVPEEFVWIVEKESAFLYEQYYHYKYRILDVFLDTDRTKTRGEIAREWIPKNKDISAALFLLLDNREIDDTIWKMVKPKGDII